MNEQFKVTVNGQVILAKAGTLLSNIIDIEKPCGGNGKCGKCKAFVNGKEELSCKYKVYSDITVEIPEKREILSETGAEISGHATANMCLALDIGTTTLALALVSRDEGKIVRALTATNPQRTYGADVISRIDYCMKNSVEPLHGSLIAGINRMIDELGVTEIDTMYVSGNATMLHTLHNVDCSSMGVAPYTAAFLGERHSSGSALGIDRVKSVISLPSVSSFVGADIVSGIYYTEMPVAGKYDLLVDLGTNAEIVLYSERGGIATAAAAGPCFEGANISSGMSATAGAIYAFTLEGGEASYKTVGDEAAVGICGTGLIDIIAALLKSGIIDETGYMEDDYSIAKGVSLSPEDVRQYQLAKSAICSAIEGLMAKQGIAHSDISRVYISGGFSAKINIDNASYTGLFPKELLTKTVPINNSSLLGTVKYAIKNGDIAELAQKIRYVDLSSDPDFANSFIENMIFEIDE